MPQTKLDPKHEELLKEYNLALREIFQNNLAAVILYGSAATGEFISEYSNFNLLVVLENAELSYLKGASELVNKLKFKRIRPIFMDEKFIASSADVFPVEFSDMKDSYLILMGKDVLADLRIDLKNLRFQCEQELKEKLLNMKQQYLLISHDKLEVKNLLFKSFTSVIYIFRNILRIKGVIPSVSKIEILRQASVELSIRIDTFKRVLEAKSNPNALTGQEAENLFFDFVRDLEISVNILDKIHFNDA